MDEHPKHSHDRHGAKQPERFDPARALLLDDPSRLDYLPLAQICGFLAAPRGARVVDFGTGTGTFAIGLARQRPDLEVVALDEQPEMLQMLRAKPAARLANLKPVLTDGLAGLRGTADRVLALNVLHELGDDALRGLVGLLAPEGRALFVDWNAEVERPVGPPRDHVYTVAEARARLERADLIVEAEHALRYHFVLTARRR